MDEPGKRWYRKRKVQSVTGTSVREQWIARSRTVDCHRPNIPSATRSLIGTVMN